jgi:hypothetical protein
MFRKSLFTSGSDYLNSSIQEIENTYEECDKNADLTKKKIADKYQEKEIESIIGSIEKVKNSDIRITNYRNKLKYFLWIVLLLTALPVPILYSTNDLSPLIFSLTVLVGLLPFVVALVIFYSKYNSAYSVILIIYTIVFFLFSSFDELIEGIYEFSLEPIFLFFSVFI